MTIDIDREDALVIMAVMLDRVISLSAIIRERQELGHNTRFLQACQEENVAIINRIQRQLCE